MPFFGVPIRNGLPIGLGSVAGFGVQQFDPSQLFEGGTVAGAWYDPSDLSTMFTTSAGTTPVAMPGQGSAVSVGAMLDKRATGYSLFFGGAGNCLTTPNSADLQLGSTYTVECWVYRTGTGTNIRIFSDGNTNANNVDIYIATGTNFISFFGGITSSAYVLPLNTWVHIALVVTAGIPALYANGIAQTLSGTLTGVNSTATTTRIIGASNFLGANGFVGNIFNLRVVKGTAVYTGNFTPPTAPLSPITGTSLLTCGTAWSGNPAITAVGNTRIDGLNPFTASPVGNHAIAFNDTTARPELRARVNLLEYSEQFDQGTWTKTATTISANAETAPDGTLSADKLVETAATSSHIVFRSATVAANVSYKFISYAKASERSFLQITFSTAEVSGNPRANFDLTSGELGSVDAGIVASIVPAGNGWFRCEVTVTAAGTTLNPGLFIITSKTAVRAESYAGDITKGLFIWGADLRPANIGANVPAYQRIADANTYDTSGFPLYLRFDGIDDSMYTPANLDLSGTDKVSVFAGVRKNADAASGQVFTELSSSFGSNNGSFGLLDVGAPNYTPGFGSRGTATAYPYPASGYSAPLSMVLTGIGNIAAPLAQIRANGSVAASSTASQGTGNYGTYPLYIGSRANASFFLNGHLHSLIIAGSAVSAGNISATEQWVAGKVGLVIP